MRKHKVSVNPLEIDRRLLAIGLTENLLRPTTKRGQREHRVAFAIALRFAWNEAVRDLPADLVPQVKAIAETHAMAKKIRASAKLKKQREVAGG